MSYQPRDVEAEKQAGIDEFDRLYAQRLQRERQQQQAQQPPAHPSRRAAIQALIEQGATEGERDAARRALERIELEEYEDALAHGAA